MRMDQFFDHEPVFENEPVFWEWTSFLRMNQFFENEPVFWEWDIFWEWTSFIWKWTRLYLKMNQILFENEPY